MVEERAASAAGPATRFTAQHVELTFCNAYTSEVLYQVSFVGEGLTLASF
jgi:hypothetical protein